MQANPAEFFIALWILVLAEGFLKVTPETVLMRRTATGRWRLFYPSFYPGNGSWGWFWIPPLPPANLLYLAMRGSVFVSEGKLIRIDRTTQALRIVSLDQGATVDRVDADLMVDGEKFHCFPSTAAAREEVRRIDSARDKTAKIETAETLSGRASPAEIESAVRPMQLLSFAQVFFIFVILPIALVLLGADRILIPAMLALLATDAIVAGLYFVVAGKLRMTDGLWLRCCKYFFYPPASLSAVSDVSRDAFAGVDLIDVIAARLECREQRSASIREFQDRFRFLIPGAGDLSVAALLAQTTERARQVLGIENALDLIARPERAASSNQSYCPLCGTQYLFRTGQCAECRDTTTSPFEMTELEK